jgi:hypothetical protein
MPTASTARIKTGSDFKPHSHSVRAQQRTAHTTGTLTTYSPTYRSQKEAIRSAVLNLPTSRLTRSLNASFRAFWNSVLPPNCVCVCRSERRQRQVMKKQQEQDGCGEITNGKIRRCSKAERRLERKTADMDNTRQCTFASRGSCDRRSGYSPRTSNHKAHCKRHHTRVSNHSTHAHSPRQGTCRARRAGP